ncbi:Uncharacterised protein [Mycobacterium tuberculosis]|nr:Uncharacterised protein [Mycobacterium tuberculosis]
MKLPQNPLLRQVHRFRESLLLLLYYSLSFLGVRWMRTGHPRVAAVWSVGLWLNLVLRGGHARDERADRGSFGVARELPDRFGR